MRHIALVVPDLREAEAYYLSLFDMHLIGREVMADDGRWYTLPRDKHWDDAAAVGINLHMLALRQDDWVLTLFEGHQPPGEVLAIGLTMSPRQVAGVRSRLTDDVFVIEDSKEQLSFRDRYAINWQFVPPDAEFLMNGDRDGFWLDV